MKKNIGLIVWLLLFNIENSSIGANLVINGDFEAGNTGFSTGYTYTDVPQDLLPEGHYAICTDPTKSI
jgi:hypothetical protein